MVCYGIFWSGQFSCDYMGNIPERMVDLIFFTILLSKVLVIRRHQPHVIIDTQMTVNISSLAICRSLYSIFRAIFIKITKVFFMAARL